jgi:heme-degrading monooxygenase HmoA
MHHTRIALYDIKSGTFDDIVSQARAGLVPLYKSSPGFLNLGVAKIDKAAFVSLSTWETRDQADKATTMAADWVKANGREQYALRENFVGDLAIDTDTRESVGTVR